PAAHPDLHSFPTRRSSDLNGNGDAARLERAAMRRAVHAERKTAGDRQPRLRQRAPEGARVFDAGGCRIARTHDRELRLREAGAGDRKSTRLNSSHSQISYA